MTFSRASNAIATAVDTIAMVRSSLVSAGQLVNSTGALSNALQLVGAFGDPPAVSGMDFDRKKVAYYFDQVNDVVQLTSSIGLLNQLDKAAQLKPLGMQVPTSQLLEKIIPDELAGFNFNNILPSFAGLDLASLLPDLKMPDGAGDHVKITHQFDDQTQSGWVQADVDLPFAGPSTVFSAGPVQVTIANIDFTATVRIEVGTNGSPQQNAHGQITADWDLKLGGQPIVTFVDTALTFDQTGKTKFQLSPDKVRLNGVLQLISQAPALVSDPDDGFSLKLLQKDGLPIGVQAILELPLPDIAAGVSAISNIQFGALFGLEVVPEFALSVRIHVSEETAPFAIIIFILGGGGWIAAEARYVPSTGDISADLTIGISVGGAAGDRVRAGQGRDLRVPLGERRAARRQPGGRDHAHDRRVAPARRRG